MGCPPHGRVATPPGALTPGKAEGGIFRAVFGGRASRARLQWKNVTALDGNACRASLKAWGMSFTPLPERGGRARRYYSVSSRGLASLRAARESIEGLSAGVTLEPKQAQS